MNIFFQLLLLFSIQFHHVFSITEDQFGETDWTIQNIGFIEQTSYQNKSIFVSTSDNILASLNIRTGELDWRVILPTELAIDKLIVDKGSIYTFSKNGLLQAWSTANGELLWTQSLSSGKLASIESNHVSSISIDSNAPITQLGVIYILFRNCFFAISPLKGQILSQFCPNIEIPSSLVTPMITKKEFTLMELFSNSEKVIYNKPYPVLAGSLASPGSEDGVEDKFVLLVTIANRALSLVEIQVFPSSKDTSTLSSSSLFLQQQKYFSFDYDSEVATLTIFTISNPHSIFTLDLSSTFSKSSPSHQFSFTTRSTVAGTTVIQICQQLDLSITQNNCVIVGIEMDSSEKSFIARQIHSIQGQKDQQVYISFEEDFSFTKSGVVKNILSLSFSSSSSSSDAHLTLITPLSSGQYALTHSTFSRSLAPSLLSSLYHISFSTYISKSTSETNIKLLLQSSFGSLSLIQPGRGVGWSREESLSRVRQGVILDNTAVLENKGLTNIPTFQKRLELQVEDLKSKITSIRSSIQSIPTTIADLIHDSLPPHLAATLLPSYKVPKKEMNVNVDLFGFNKISVQLTSRCVVDESKSFERSEFIQCMSGFQIIALDLVTGSTLWSFTPEIITALPQSFLTNGNLFSFTANLLKIRLHSRATHPAELGLVISIEGLNGNESESALLTYQFHALTGAKLIGKSKSSQSCESDLCFLSHKRSPDHVLLGAGHVHSIQLVDAHLSEKLQSQQHHHSDQSYYQHSTQHYLLIHSNPTIPCVSIFPFLSSSEVHLPHGSHLYSHDIPQEAGSVSLTSYKVNFNNFKTMETEEASSIPIYLFSLQSVGRVVFAGDSDSELFQERIVSVVYPQPHEPIHQMAKVLGDDSLLLKYLNPHMIVVITEKEKEWIENEEIQNEQDSTSTSSSTDNQFIDELYVTVVDSVSSQIIYRGSILHASQPVTVSLIENTIAVSYWNTNGQRYELSSIHLYEGMIGKYGLGPTSSSLDSTRSAYNSPPPIALQKSFILPRGITSMHHTITERGITNKNLLLGLSTGQLLALDTRVIDPRRPIGTPSPMEKEEGLMQYIPFLMWTPLQMLTVNTTLPTIQTIISASSHLESTSLVLSYGTDVFFTRATPSKGFDLLASDFNKPLLALIVGGMAVIVILLKNYNNKRILNKQWV